jgi:T4 RnlA family RNA ligase
MSLLCDYLNANFSSGYSNEDLANIFLTEFGVAVRFSDNKVLFKYDMLEADFTKPVTKLCRGHIVKNVNGVWKTICNPFDKFHNLHEGHCPIFDKSIFEAEASKLSATIKADGSLINAYWDEDVNDWKVSTSGSITPGPVSDYPITFDALFWQIFGVDKKDALSSIGKEYTVIFELCSVMNRIVSRYKNDRVYLLAIRHNETGEYLDASKYENILGVKMPEQVSLTSVGVKTQEELVKWVEDTTQDDEDVQYKEGYVIYREGIPVAKVKAKRYLSLHHIGGGDVGCTRNNIIECFFAGSIDDIYGFLVDSMKVFADGLRSKVVALNQQVNVSIHELKGLSFATQKEYALWVLSHVDKQFSAFFFANKEKLMKGELEPDAFTHWLKLSYKRFEDYWKS